MRTVLYADVLFVINLGMDFISLWLTFAIVHRSCGAVRLFVSSAVGGLYGVLSVVFDLSGIIAVMLSVTVSVFMILIATKSKLTPRSVIKLSFILWGIGALLGGVTSLLISFGKVDPVAFKTHNAPFFILALAGLVSSFLIKAFSSLSHLRCCRADISIFGENYTASLLVDSGNLVKESISGYPVVFLSKKLFKGCLNECSDIIFGGIDGIELLPPDLKRRLRIVNVERSGVSRAILSFIPDEVILQLKKERKIVKCVIAVENTDDYGGYDGIIPASLIK